MSNDDKPFGFWPIKMRGGAFIPVTVHVQDANETIYPGDALDMPSTAGVVDVADANHLTAGISASYNLVTDLDVYVYDDPQTIFGVQEDGDTTALASTDRGKQRDLLATTGNTSTLRSQQEIDSDGTSYNNFQILDIIDRPGNTWGTHADIAILIVEHAFQPLVA